MDLMALRPDVVAQALEDPATAQEKLPACVKADFEKVEEAGFTFRGCRSAGGGQMEGTVAVVRTDLEEGGIEYAESFDVTVNLDEDRKWTYKGKQTLKASGSVLHGATDNPLLATFSDLKNPKAGKTYLVSATWAATVSESGRFSLNGSFGLRRMDAETLAMDVPALSPLVWTPACPFPGSGTLRIQMSGADLQESSTAALFGPACGQVAIGAGAFTLDH
jgi:hypothetical protein